MSNLRAPATPVDGRKVDALMTALRNHDDEQALVRLGFLPGEIEALRRVATAHNETLAIATRSLIRVMLDTMGERLD